MSKKQLKTYKEIYSDPVRSDISWSDIEKLFLYLGADIQEGNGSRVRVVLNGIKAVFHRPHPERVTDKGAVKSVRKFLNNSGIDINEVHLK